MVTALVLSVVSGSLGLLEILTNRTSQDESNIIAKKISRENKPGTN